LTRKIRERRNAGLKRIIDLSVSLISIISIFPFWIVVALLIKLESRGEVFFRQERVGLNQETFQIIKFRTMVTGAQSLGTGIFSFENDPRITRIGRVLRQWSIDESPQLINILKGEMSIVGPRPPVVGELEQEKVLPEGYEKRFQVRPGVTGLAQISGRNSLNWKNKIIKDLEYVENFRRLGLVLLDLKIIYKSVFIVLARENVVEKEIP